MYINKRINFSFNKSIFSTKKNLMKSLKNNRLNQKKLIIKKEFQVKKKRGLLLLLIYLFIQ